MAQNGVPFTYDQNGNLTSTSSATYTYTPENWLATATDNGNSATYLYDADGWRAKKTIAGDTIFYVRGPVGELLTEWHDLGGTARARDYVYAGTRLLSAIDRPVAPLSTCGGQAIPDGSPTSLTIPAGGVGTFTFEGSACRKVSASITGVDGGQLLAHLPQVENSEPERQHPGVVQRRVRWGHRGPVVLPTSGTYTVLVYSYAPYSGTVTVKVHDVVDVTGPIVFGQAVNATLDTPGQRGRWTFTGIANRWVSAVVHTSNFPTCGTYNSFVILKPDGSTLGSSSWSVCGGSIIGPFLMPTTGTYVLIVDPYKSGTGQVAVSAYDVVDVTGPISLDGSPMHRAVEHTWTASAVDVQWHGESNGQSGCRGVDGAAMFHLQLVRVSQAGRHATAGSMGYVHRSDRRPGDVAHHGNLYRARRSGWCVYGAGDRESVQRRRRDRAGDREWFAGVRYLHRAGAARSVDIQRKRRVRRCAPW